MSEPWFEPAYYAWIPGTFLGIAGGLLGSLTGICAPRGKFKRLVLGLACLVVGASIVSFTVAIVALAAGQPWPIWYMFGLAGLLGLAVVGPLIPLVNRVYQQAEDRRIAARDLE